MLDAMLAL